MRAMVLEKPGAPLVPRDVPTPEPGPGQVRLRVRACGVCRTDLHVCDGELPNPKLPLVPGHEIVGIVDKLGEGVAQLSPGDRLGVPWLGRACGVCPWCRSGRENLCDYARFTGYHLDGGYAEVVIADAGFCFPLPGNFDDAHAAPLLCAGLIGYRAFRLATSDAGRGPEPPPHNRPHSGGQSSESPSLRPAGADSAPATLSLGLYGFGAAAHILAQFATAQGCRVLAFTRNGDTEGQAFAKKLGAAWAGDSTAPPPEPLDAAIIFAPVGALVPAALRAVAKGGRVVCAGIHMSDIPSFPYSLLWEERHLLSVANLTRRDGREFLAALHDTPVQTTVRTYPLAEANTALDDLRRGRLEGAAVLVP
ncbi:MAG TPA: zinc-dependent alcohol dehydrogenase family protein [Opitutus sp.]|nr:zinc-dependent alcohol dehydrogenase family protein [Opitutus sp.]